ncbi:uncharacterized protein LOC103958534 [Pyrus x bretschneideri]|uniref:uncharacterized protein LOC103958534 n=1 Tax=Pyrus x bretschneideri TaxID=225117 RepID=UPI00202FE5A3|nr:uncharacterized protein LOC103958534 [Pyrus x bretschneideri]
MASPAARITFRIVIIALVVLVLFYIGRPLYWKISATIHEIRQNRQTVKQGISQIVLEAQKSVGWYHDESDSGARDYRAAKNVGLATNRRLLLRQVS